MQIVYSNILYYPVMYIMPFVILLYLNSRLIRALNEIRQRKEALTGELSEGASEKEVIRLNKQIMFKY